MSTNSLSLRIHPLRHMIRLEGRADITHPEHGIGAEFHMVIPTYIIVEDMTEYANRLGAGEHQGFEASQVHGEVIWDSGARSEIIWVESERTEYPDEHLRALGGEGRISLDIEVSDPWPPAGSGFTSHRLFDLPAAVPGLIVSAVDHWESGNKDMADIALRAMAGLTPYEGSPKQDGLAVLAALRLPGGVFSQPDPDRFALPL